MVQKVIVKHEFEAGLHHVTTGKFKSINPAVNWYLFRMKGEGWAPPFVSYAQDTVGL